jgi:hypothetical protein
MKIKNQEILENELNLQKKLMIDSYELKVQHQNNAAERNIRKLEQKFDKNLNVVVSAHEKEIVDLKVQFRTSTEELKQHELMKYNELLKLYHHQKVVIANLEKTSSVKNNNSNAPLVDVKPQILNLNKNNDHHNRHKNIDENTIYKKYTELLSKYNHIISVYKDIRNENNAMKLEIIKLKGNGQSLLSSSSVTRNPTLSMSSQHNNHLTSSPLPGARSRGAAAHGITTSHSNNINNININNGNNNNNKSPYKTGHCSTPSRLLRSHDDDVWDSITSPRNKTRNRM